MSEVCKAPGWADPCAAVRAGQSDPEPDARTFHRPGLGLERPVANDHAWRRLDPACEGQFCAWGMTNDGDTLLMTIDLEATSPEAAARGYHLLQRLAAAAASDRSGMTAFRLRQCHYAAHELGQGDSDAKGA